MADPNRMNVRIDVESGRLVTFPSESGFHLNGMLYDRGSSGVVVIHVHGSLGNFYQNAYIGVMGATYASAGIRFLSFNLSSHDGVAEGSRNVDDFEYSGGSIVAFDRCIEDICGAIAFARRFGDVIVLQGHSLGCDRVLLYCLEREAPCSVILLGPCDSYALQTTWIAPESVEEQIVRLRSEFTGHCELDWLPAQEYGIRSGDEEYYIPVTRAALLSIMEGPVFRLLRIDQPSSFQLTQRAFVYLGGNDPFQTSNCDVMFRHLESRLGSVTRCFVPHGGHSLEGCETTVAEQIVDWIEAIEC